MKKLFGFTLTEVLITLGILGVVAALTLPILMTDMNKHQWATALKTDKSLVERAFAQMLAENNVDTLDLTPLWENIVARQNDNGVKDITDDVMKDLFKVEKKGTGKLSDKITGINGTGAFTGVDTYKSYALPNGMFLYASFHAAAPEGVFADIYIDVNGKKLPNSLGKDIFAFGLSNNARLLPYGSDELNEIGGNGYLKWNTQNGCKGKLNTIKDGRYCTARVVENDYVIDYLK